MTNDRLCRLFYLDTLFPNRKDMTPEKREIELAKIAQSIETLITDDIRKKLTVPTEIAWFNRFRGKNFTKELLDTKSLYVERFQHINWGGVKNSGGKRMFNYKDHVRIDTQFHVENLPLFEKYDLIPIVEKIGSEKYEILFGHHRTLALIRSRQQVPVFLIKRGDVACEIRSSLTKLTQIGAHYKNRILGK